MSRKLVLAFLFVMSGALVAHAQQTGKITGTVEDVSGSAVVGATITVTDLTSGAVTHTQTAADGHFRANGLARDRFLVSVEKGGFEPFTQRVSLTTEQTATLSVRLTVMTLSQSVVVRGTVIPGARPVPTRVDVLKSDQTIRVLDRKQLDAAGPVAGGAQMIAYTPGANVFGYGQTGATKYTIQLNGINQGWGGEAPGFISPGSLGVTFDGVPVSDVATGLWQSATMPQNLLIQNLAVTYGPGDPKSRFYDNVGGGVEFTPIQPTIGTHLSVQGTYGSFNQKNIAFVLNTGGFHGWSTVISGGVGSGDSFRTAPDGFNNHSKDGSVFAKTIRMFSAGSFELGGYYSKAGGFRNQTIPLSHTAGVYYTYDPTTGSCAVDTPGQGTNYAEDSSGYYSGLPYNCYNKYDTNAMWMLYGRENLLLNSTTTLTNMTWYSAIHRLHNRLTDVFAGPPGSGQINEWNNPHTDSFGDELGLSKVLPLNTVAVGAYYIHALYNSQNDFYDPSLGGNGPLMIPNQGGKIRSGYFDQDDVALYAQDTFHPIPQIHITPGIRFVAFQTSYSDQAYRVFNLSANNVVLSQHCSLYPKSSDPFLLPGNATDQGSICGSHESRTGVEPSISAGVMPFHWLSIYGGYSTEYHSPSLGGGGGMFQKIDPAAYLLAEGKYAQAGFKVHFANAPVLKNTIFGLAYYHLDYDNQEIDYETATGNELTSGGSSTFHGVNIFFDDDPVSNLHIFANFNGESAHFVTYNSGNPPSAPCISPAQGGSCYNNIPVSYTPSTTMNFGVYYGIALHERVLVEPRFSFDYIGSQHLWNDVTGAPDSMTMPGYGTANLSFVAPIKKYVNLSVTMTNLFNKKYNEFEYISSGGYFTPFTGTSAGAILGYPGAPLSTYGTISFQF